MEVSSSTNASQSLALAAYTAQQQQGLTRARDRDRDNESVEPNRSTESRRGDNVSFSSEALRLSAQNELDSSRNTVKQSNESETANRQQQQAANPQITRAESANSVAQAINAYSTTSVI